MLDRQSRAKIANAYRESGAIGVLRRSVRTGLMALREQIAQWEHSLYYAEAAARLTGEQRFEGRRTEERFARFFAGQTVFVLGTGPSLNQLDLSKLAGRSSIGVNSFYRHPVVKSWRPSLYCFMDETFFLPSSDTVGYFAEVVAALPEVPFLVTGCDLKDVSRRGLLPYERSFYVATDGELGTARKLQFRMSELLPAAPNSVMFATFLAVLSGAKNVVLLGADHDWLARPNPVQQVLDPHFYGGPEVFAPPTNTDAAWNELRSYHATIKWCDLLWRCYSKLRQIAAARGSRILNATPGSFLDVFETVDYDQAVNNLG